MSSDDDSVPDFVFIQSTTQTHREISQRSFGFIERCRRMSSDDDSVIAFLSHVLLAHRQGQTLRKRGAQSFRSVSGR